MTILELEKSSEVTNCKGLLFRCVKSKITKLCQNLRAIWGAKMSIEAGDVVIVCGSFQGQVMEIVYNPAGPVMYRVQYPCDWGKTSLWFLKEELEKRNERRDL